MKEETNEKIKLAEGRFGEWLDGYLKGEIDSSILPILAILDVIFRWDISDKQKSNLNVVIECLIVKGSLSAKEEQAIKNTFNDGTNALNHSTESDREEIMQTMSERILDIIARTKQNRR